MSKKLAEQLIKFFLFFVYHQSMEFKTLSKDELLQQIEKLQNENRLLRAEREKIQNNVKILIAKISHEMKTPLNSIIGFSELFKYKTKDNKLLEYINNILSSSIHMSELIKNLIDISQCQYKPIELSYSIFNIKDTIEDIIKSFPDKNINYTLIDLMINADYTRFRELVYNLISNALKYNKKNKQIELVTYTEDSQFCFEIKNYGEGIKEADYDRIFEFFTQVSEDINKRQIGSGIGLALCKAIVDAHGGEINVSSALEEGTTFIFKLPCLIG